MTWHCKSCNRNFLRDPRIERAREKIDGEQQILFCPYCSSDKIEIISN